MDFTLKIYRHLLEAILQADYCFFTFEEYCNQKASGKYIILRHDVDLKANNSLETAKIEHELGIKASYFFRVVPQSNQPDKIKAIADLGHEIGYHYEDLSLFKGDIEKSILHFGQQLAYFRQFYPVKTICMHGSPTSKYDNRKIWETYNYRDYDIIGEPYFDFLNLENVLYFTDTGRCWDGDKYNVRDKRIGSNELNQPKFHSTAEFIEWIKNSQNQLSIMITTHPQRWTNKPIEWFNEYWMQLLKNRIKKFLNKKR
jgi:hypothetical protein